MRKSSSFRTVKHLREDGSVNPIKACRNRIYKLCGVLILFALATLAVKTVFGRGWPFWTDYNLTFWFESLALWSFGLSWALKGRFGPFSDTVLGRLVLDPEDCHLPGNMHTKVAGH